MHGRPRRSAGARSHARNALQCGYLQRPASWWSRTTCLASWDASGTGPVRAEAIRDAPVGELLPVYRLRGHRRRHREYGQGPPQQGGAGMSAVADSPGAGRVHRAWPAAPQPPKRLTRRDGARYVTDDVVLPRMAPRSLPAQRPTLMPGIRCASIVVRRSRAMPGVLTGCWTGADFAESSAHPGSGRSATCKRTALGTAACPLPTDKVRLGRASRW